MKRAIFGLWCLLVGSSFSGLSAAENARDRIDAMASKLAATEKFSVTMMIRYEVLQESGQIVEFSERRELKVSRPSSLRVDVRQSDGDIGGLVFDGETFSQFNTSLGVYSRIHKEADLDNAIRYGVARLGIRFPLARLLVTTLPRELEQLTTEAALVEVNTLQDALSYHVIGTSQEIDYQFWISEEKLPLRIVLTYKNAPGAPRFRADFSNWDMSPNFEPDTFVFQAPAGAEQIPSLVPSQGAGVEAGHKGVEK